jgi:Domain of unknown function (DUF5753)/Helix-turn-helix domain
MPMAHSPAVARLIVRVALRGARETGSMTQGEVARSLDWSLSKVQRIESGDVNVSTTDLMAMVNHYGNVTAEDATRLVELVRVSRKGTGWWDRPEYKEFLTPPTLELIQFENEATTIRVFNPLVLPGLLQTQQYASGVIDTWLPGMDPRRKAITLESRSSRQTNFFARKPKPGYHVLLDESVLRRRVGAAEVMVDQLKDLLRAMDSGRVDLRILKHETAFPSRANPFIVLSFGDRKKGGSTDSALYEEAFPGDRIITDLEQIKVHRNIFDRMWDTAAAGDDAKEFLRHRLVRLGQ